MRASNMIAELVRKSGAAGASIILLFLIYLTVFCGTVHAQALRGAETPDWVPPPIGEERYDYAEMDSQVVPASMEANQLYAVTINMANWGDTTWTGAQRYTLIPVGPAIWGVSEVAIPQDAQPGEVASFTFYVRAPAAPGIYAFQWKMRQGLAGSFGTASTSLSITVTPPPPINNASVISNSFPGQILTGRTYTASVTMQNTGNTTWTRAEQYTLMAQAPHNNTTWGLNRVPLPAESVQPGEAVTFNFQVTAPNAPGSYASQWGMQREGYGSFGASTNTLTVNVKEPVNNASFVGQSVPTQMEAGKRYNVSVTMVNNSEATWSTAAAYSLGSQNPQDNGVWGGGRVGLPGDIAPGQTAVFNFQVTAPQMSGPANFQWRMVQDGKEWFGAYSNNVVVNVVPTPRNDTALMGQSNPAQMTAGRSYPATVVMRNTGNTTWTSAASYSLAVLQVNGMQYWNGGRVALPRSVAPGEDVAFIFDVVAPATPGIYSMPLQMVQDGVELFGALSNSATINVVAAPARNDAAAVAMDIPSRMISGRSYPVSVTMRNTGDTTWSAGTLYRLGEAGGIDNVWGVGRVELTSAVAPGQQYTFAFQVTPSAVGNYDMQWRMVQDGVEFFGAPVIRPVSVTENLGNVTFIHTDGLGSPVARTDASGNVISRTRYEPYGYTASGATPTIGFTGHVNDTDTGLTYMQQRYYDPVAGRFLSIDPVVTDTNTGSSFNRYTYANNSPYSYIDPDGRNGVGIIARALSTGIQGIEKLIARRAWRKSEKELIERTAVRGPNGGKICPDCKNEVDKFDINHRKKWGDTQGEIIERAKNGDAPTRAEVREMYGKDIDGKCASCNRADNKLDKAGAAVEGTVAAGTAEASDSGAKSSFFKSAAEFIVDIIVSPSEAGAGSDIVPEPQTRK